MRYFKLLNQEIIVIFVLIAITFFSYINILQNNFAYDDEDFFVNWETIRDIHNIPQLLTGELPANHQGVYRPLRSIFYVLSYRIWGNNPAGYHFQSILIHLAIVLIIYKILRLITKNKFIAFGSSAVFATHPIHTEAITYTTASMDTIGILFFFISFYFYLSSQNNGVRKIRHLLFSALSALIAFFTYEMTLTLPLIIVGYDFVFHRINELPRSKAAGYPSESSSVNHSSKKQADAVFWFKNKKSFLNHIKAYLPLFLILFSYAYIRIFVVQIGNRAQYLGENFLIVSRQARVETIEIVSQYIYLLIFPYNLTVAQQLPTQLLAKVLDFLYLIDKNERLIHFMTRVDFLIPVVLLIGILGMSWIIFKKSQIILFSFFWFFLSLAPILSIIPQGSTITERYLYIPSFGFSLLLTYLFYISYQKAKKVSWHYLSYLIVACFILINILYVARTILRNQDWKTPITLWSSAVKANTAPSLAYAALGKEYYMIKDYQNSLNFLNTSLSYDKQNELAYFYLGRIAEEEKSYEKAIKYYVKINKINSKYASPYHRLGIIYFEQGLYDEAIKMQELAIKYAPMIPDYYYNLAVSYERKNDFQKALSYYQKTLAENPYHILALNNSAIILSKSNLDNLALELLNKAVEINPNEAKSYFNLAVIYEKNNSLDQAISNYKKGLALNPSEESAIKRLDALLER